MRTRSFLLTLILLSGFAGEASANFIYWTSRFDQSITVGDTNSLTTSTILFSSSLDPWGIAVDVAGNQIYLTDGKDPNDPISAVKRVGTDGSGLTTLSTGNHAVRQIELDLAGGKMYWAAEGGVGGSDGDTIYRANLDGSSQEVLATGLWNPRGLALDLAVGKIYYNTFVPSTFTRTIYRANLDGSNRETVLTGQSSAIWGMDLDSINHKLYWGTSDTRVVSRANLDGTGVETVLSALPFDVLDIKVDPFAGVFYAAGDNFGGTPGGAIVRANLDGSNLTTLFSDVNATNIFLAPSSMPAVPEPSSILLAAMGGAIALLKRLPWNTRLVEVGR